MRFDLTDEEWAIIEPLLPPRIRGPKRVDDRKILNGIFYILRTGAPWRDLPERYGPRTTVYNRYARWARRGVWRGIFEALAQNSEDSLLFIDGSIVKAHRASTGAKGRGERGPWPRWGRVSSSNAQDVGRSRGGRSSKIHAVVNEKGLLIRAVITGGQVHDSQAIPALFEPDLNAPLAVVADKAYGSKAIRKQIADEGALAVIPSKSNAKTPIPHDPNLYAMRNVVERFFCRMKDMRRLATRFEKLSCNFLAMLHLFAIRQWCN